MLQVTINAEGKQWSDLVLAVEEALKSMEQECYAGGNSNDDGKYSFKVTGEPDDVGDYEE